MESFREEYIKHLEDYCSTLQNKYMDMKELENRLFRMKANVRVPEMTLQEVTNICNSTCEAIDNLFQNITATMDSLKILLLHKSQISQIPKRLLHIQNVGPGETNHLDPDQPNSENSNSVCEKSEGKKGKRCGTVKVSPMVNGHVISSLSVQLNRLNKNVETQHNQRHSAALSPIIEKSPTASPQTDGKKPEFREFHVCLRRLNHKNYTGRASLVNGSHNLHKTDEGKETRVIDPLEGPSWLLDKPQGVAEPRPSFSQCPENERGSITVPHHSFRKIVNHKQPMQFNGESLIENSNTKLDEDTGEILLGHQDLSGNEDSSSDQSSEFGADDNEMDQASDKSPSSVFWKKRKEPILFRVISRNRNNLLNSTENNPNVNSTEDTSIQDLQQSKECCSVVNLGRNNEDEMKNPAVSCSCTESEPVCNLSSYNMRPNNDIPQKINENSNEFTENSNPHTLDSLDNHSPRHSLSKELLHSKRPKRHAAKVCEQLLTTRKKKIPKAGNSK